ncbi:hypothetical protein ACHAXR_004554 [Thalassiosira sp. AJA248-18]
MHRSYDGGGSAAFWVFFVSLCSWEVMYHIAKYSLKVCLDKHPNRILSSSLVKNATKDQGSNGHSNGDAQSSLDDAKHTLLQRGPSYIVSFVHSIYATGRGIMHLYNLYNAPGIEKLLIAGKEIQDGYRWAHLQVGETNTVFLSYLSYDLIHILLQYPKLGGVDTIIHHLLFASCSVINGTFGIMIFAFGWLVVGEGSTIFLNIRWFLLKSGRGESDIIGTINRLFAATFFLTRIGIYSVGVVHLFYYNLPELLSLPEKSGVPVPLLGMTCGCMLLGWALNILWGYKILGMVRGKKIKKKLQ